MRVDRIARELGRGRRWGPGKIDSGNNGVTDLHNSYPRVITALKVLLELEYL